MSGRRLPPSADGLRRKLAAIGPEGMAQRLGWSGAVEVLQLISSLLVFIVLAKLLSISDYGRLGAVLGVAGTTAALGSFGSHVLLIKRVSQGEPLAQSWKRSTSIAILGLGAGALIIIGLQPVLFANIDRSAFALLIVAQVNFFWLTELAVFVGTATRRLKEAAQIRFLVLVCRLAALAWFALYGNGELIRWAAASFVSFGVAVVLALTYIWRVFGPLPSLRHGSIADLREGTPFSVNAGSESLVDVSDRPMLIHYDKSVDAGIYSLGGRIVQFGYLPLRVIMRASDADLFAAGKRGTASALRVTRSLLGPMLAVSISVGVALATLAPVVPIIAGSEYNEAIDAIRLLAALPLIRAAQYLMGNCLSASDHQWWRVGATLSAAVVNFSLNLLLLPTGTWRTAVFTTMVSELYLTGVLSVLVFYWVVKERTSNPADTLVSEEA